MTREDALQAGRMRHSEEGGFHLWTLVEDLGGVLVDVGPAQTFKESSRQSPRSEITHERDVSMLLACC